MQPPRTVPDRARLGRRVPGCRPLRPRRPQAAHAKHVFAIGADTGQGAGRPWVMTSARQAGRRRGPLGDPLCSRRLPEDRSRRRVRRASQAASTTPRGARSSRHASEPRSRGCISGSRPERSAVSRRRSTRCATPRCQPRPFSAPSPARGAGPSRSHGRSSRARSLRRRFESASSDPSPSRSLGSPSRAARSQRCNGSRSSLAAAGSVSGRAISAVAAANPESHFALVGASVQQVKQPNLVGIVFRETQAAQLGGILAGYTAAGEGVAQPPVAWVGPASLELVRSFRHGVHQVAAGVTVLVDRTPATPAACKESALGRSCGAPSW